MTPPRSLQRRLRVMVALGVVLFVAVAVGVRAVSSPAARLAPEPLPAARTTLPTTIPPSHSRT